MERIPAAVALIMQSPSPHVAQQNRHSPVRDDFMFVPSPSVDRSACASVESCLGIFLLKQEKEKCSANIGLNCGTSSQFITLCPFFIILTNRSRYFGLFSVPYYSFMLFLPEFQLSEPILAQGSRQLLQSSQKATLVDTGTYW